MERIVAHQRVQAVAAIVTLLACATAAHEASRKLRFWIDQYAWSDLSETILLREALAQDSNGRGEPAALLAGETRSALLQLKGYQQLQGLDVYWTARVVSGCSTVACLFIAAAACWHHCHDVIIAPCPRPLQGCYAAFQRPLNATHAISCCPGSEAITGKAELVATMVAALGQEEAFALLPRSYVLPRDYSQLVREVKLRKQQSWVTGDGESSGSSRAKHACSAVCGSSRSSGGGVHNRAACPWAEEATFSSALPGLWVLKEDAHRGRGLAIASSTLVLKKALERSLDGRRRFVLAQRFLAPQHLVGGRPYYVRLWVVLAGAELLRGYLFDGGVVVFGQEQQGQGQGGQRQGQGLQQQHVAADAEQVADSMVVNLWRQDRAASASWSLAQWRTRLEAKAGAAAAARAWSRMQRALAAVLAAGAPALRAAAAQLPGFQEGSFEVLGADFLVDASLRPWLVELNYMPSLARKALGCQRESRGGSGGESSSGGSGREVAGGCQPDNPFDSEKARFMNALLRLLIARRDALLEASAAAEATVASWRTSGRLAPACPRAPELEQLLAMRAEAAVAAEQGFQVLTPQLWSVLERMDERCAAEQGAAQQQQRQWRWLRRQGKASGCMRLTAADGRVLAWLRSGGSEEFLCKH